MTDTKASYDYSCSVNHAIGSKRSASINTRRPQHKSVQRAWWRHMENNKWRVANTWKMRTNTTQLVYMWMPKCPKRNTLRIRTIFWQPMQHRYSSKRKMYRCGVLCQRCPNWSHGGFVAGRYMCVLDPTWMRCSRILYWIDFCSLYTSMNVCVGCEGVWHI